MFLPVRHGRRGAGAMVVTRAIPFIGVVPDPGVFQRCGLFVLLGAEFLAMILGVVYVGAVAVLFLFVVMMLDVNFRNFAPMRPDICCWRIGGRSLLAELFVLLAVWHWASVR